MLVDSENNLPAVRIVLPGRPLEDRAIEILFPEHVTVRKQGRKDAEHLYVFRPGKQGDIPEWKREVNSLGYEKQFPQGIHMLARATLEDDGVRFDYHFSNESDISYEFVYAVTDPRLTSIFHDVRLERTYVHHKDGFDLLASEIPQRLSMPLHQWLPLRFLATFTWPVPAQRIEHRDDGITYYQKSRAVDEPMLATVSSDRKWIVVSFTRTVGNVWSNPDLTCQHVDPQLALGAHQSGTASIKILFLQGTLDDALQKVRTQRADWK